MLSRAPILLSLLAFASCKTVSKSPYSKLDTTSDKLKEFGYVVEGTIELPLNESAFKTMYLTDTYAHISEMTPGSAEAKDALARLDDPASFREDFTKSMRNAWPLMTGDKLDGSKVKYWIARQLKFNENQLREMKLSATLKDIRKWTHTIDKSRNVAKIQYEALVLGVRQITVGDDLKVSPIANGYEMSVPLNPVSFYFDALGQAGKNVYRAGSGSTAEAKALLIKDKLLESTKTAASCLISEDASTIFPFNSFYYYRFKNGCAEDALTSAKVTRTELMPVDTRYPEFHRLFEDKKVSFFVFYGIVDNEAEDAAQFGREMEKRGYKKKPDDGSGIMAFTNVIGGVTFDVTLAVEKLALTSRSEFRKSIKDSEVVVYDGHAGYGASIDGAFGEPEAYPENSYQIFVLNGCNTYKYGTTQIMHTKSVADFDFHNMNVDVISTYDAVTGHTQQRVVLKKIEDAARLIQEGNWTDQKKAAFEKTHSWLSVITDVNKDSDRATQRDNGIFMVSGEESNDYMPGKSSYMVGPEASESELIALLVDETQDEQLRMRVVTALTERKSTSLAKVSLDERLTSLKSFCRDLKVKGVVDLVLASTYHAQSCQPKSLRVNSGETYLGYVLSNEIPVSFYANGNIRRASLLSSRDIGKTSFTGRISFHENGSVASGNAMNEVVHENLTFASSVSFYADGQIRGGMLSKDAEVKGVTYKQYAKLVLDRSGVVERGTLASPAVIDGVKLPAGTDLILEAGKLKSIGSYADDVIDLSAHKVQFKKGSANFRAGKLISVYAMEEEDSISFGGQSYSQLIFHLNGKPAMQGAKGSLRGLSYPCRPDSDKSIIYHDSGALALCQLESQVTAGGASFKAGDYLMLDAKGVALTDQGRAETFARAVLKDIMPILEEDVYSEGIYDYEDAAE